ncbi:MAG TPA: bifunctional oligoribonuclease/PAP phosphatase NrnA [Bacillota bacterium]
MASPELGREAAAQALRSASRVLLLLHINADGDSVGSCLALARALEQRGARCTVAYGDRFPQAYAFLPGAASIRSWDQVDTSAGFDAAVLPDCSGIDRVGDAAALLPAARRVINIDHHISNAGFGDVRWVDPGRACVGEMVMDLVDDLGVSLDEPLALCLYTALITDTGSFRYSNTTPGSHRRAARLLEEGGVKPDVVATHVYDNRPLAALRLLGDVLATLDTSPDGRVAWVVVSRELQQRHNAGPAEAEGLVAYPRSLAGVEVALSFFEQADGRVRVAFRARAAADVARLAEGFGGGGHPRAAGCTHPGPLADAVEQVVAASVRILDEPAAEGVRL